MGNCIACKQPLKNGEPHKVSDCAEALHRALDRANLQVSELRIALMAMVDEVSDRTRFNEARELAKALLAKSEKQKCECPTYPHRVGCDQIGIFCLDHRKVMVAGVCPKCAEKRNCEHPQSHWSRPPGSLLTCGVCGDVLEKRNDDVRCVCAAILAGKFGDKCPIHRAM